MNEVQVGTSLKTDIPALKALWKQAFGDSDACISAFFESVYTPESVFVLREDGAVKAMASWLPETVCWSRKGWNAAYLYAVATDKSARGQGYCARLLAYAEAFLAPRGVKVLLLVPGEPSLRQFYRRHGYQDFTAVELREAEAVMADGTAEAVEPPAYLELREDFLASRAYVSCPVPVLAFQERLARLSGGSLIRIAQGEREGCACVAKDEAGRAVLYELLWPGNLLEGASLAASFVGADRMLIRAPGEGTPFAMAKWLSGKPKLPAPYFGIALD